MTILLTCAVVLAADLGLKALLRRSVAEGAISLGAIGSIQVVDGRIWLHQMHGRPARLLLWSLWLLPAITLVIAGNVVALSPIHAGLLLGGSLSNAVEYSRRGAVSDYVRLRFWPAFNLADLAVAVGAAGILIDLVVLLYGATA